MENERKKTYLRLIAELSVAAAAVAAVAFFGKTVLSILLPFLLALFTAWAFNPVIGFLHRHFRMTRKLFSYLLVLVFYALLGTLCLYFVGQVASQVMGLVRSAPSMLAQLQSVYNQLAALLEELLEHLPAEYDGVRTEIMSMLASAWTWLRGGLTNGLTFAVGYTSNIALEVPSFVIFLTVLILASCIITADFPALRLTIYRYLGTIGSNSVRLMGKSFRTAVLGFFRSQLIFAVVDMTIILIAFFIIGVPYPLPIALILCFLDFIPFFGAGTVLVPWGVVCLVLGMSAMGFQLLVLYAVLYILRRIFEPRVLGGSTGFSSLQMLLSMYAGMQLYGVSGLVVAPILWITAVNFFRTGIFNGLLADVRFVADDLNRTLARPVPTVTQEPPLSRAEHADKPRRK